MARSAQDPPLPTDLRVRLRRASAPELKDLLRDYGRFFTLAQVRQLLLNPFVDSEILQELATIRSLVALHPVRAAICKHPRTPEPVAMRWVPDLFWRELLEITVDVRLRGSVRTVAERYLLERLPRLTQGEKIALARRATASTVKQLAKKADPRVLKALLDNPRTTEAALMPLLTDVEASPRALAEVAGHGRWVTRYEVTLALCLNSQTPFRQIFKLLPRLNRRDLESVCGQAKHSSVVLREAEEVLASRAEARELPSPYVLESNLEPVVVDAHGADPAALPSASPSVSNCAVARTSALKPLSPPGLSERTASEQGKTTPGATISAISTLDTEDSDTLE